MALFMLDGNQSQEVELAWRLEQHAGLVQRLALRRLHCPRRIAQGKLDVVGMRRLIATPLADLAGVRKLAGNALQRDAELVFELVAQRGSVEPASDVSFVAIERLALNDLPLARE